MQSIIVLYVDHGETTDPLTKMIDDALFVKDSSVWNYELSVGVSEAEAETVLKSVIGISNDPQRPLATS